MEHTADDTAKAILDKLPEKGTFSHRKYYYQTDWDDIDIGSYADLHALAKLWLLLPEIREALDAEAVSAFYIPLFDKIEAIAGEYQEAFDKLAELEK